MGRFPSAEHGPRYEMQAIGRALDDTAPRDRAYEARHIWEPLVWSLAGLLLLMAFVGWLLVGQQISPWI
jgi:hypothetical protein